MLQKSEIYGKDENVLYSYSVAKCVSVYYVKYQLQIFGKLQFLQADILILLLDLVQDLEFAL